MTTIVVLADPPLPGFVLSDLVATAPISESEAADLYAAMLGDVCRAVERSGGELLVNYRPDDQVPDTVEDSESAIRDVVADALEDPSEARYEVQVGSTESGRIGNTVTHLLETESVTSAAAVHPTAAFVSRLELDAAAMQLRTNDVVLGPAPEGRVYFAGFTDTIDFEAAYAPPALETLATRGEDAGHDVAFVEMLPVLRSGSDLATVLPTLRARRTAGRRIPARTASVLADLELRVSSDADGPTVVRE